jgi:hypothetical protein
MMKKIYQFTACLFLLFLIGCAQPVTSGDSSSSGTANSITITSMGWIIENIDTSFWSSTPPTHAFYDFWIYFSGTNISASDITYARIYIPPNYTSYWTIDPAQYLDTQNMKIGGWGRWYSSTNCLQIGNLKAEIKLNNGTSATFTKTIPAPANTVTNGYVSVYTEDIAAPANSVSLIKRAAIGTRSNNGTTLTIVFNTNDTRVYNGWIWLYDANSNFVGASKTFFRDINGNFTTIINSGANLYTNGTNNTVSLGNSDISYNTGKTFSDISKFIVVLSDGAQYASQGNYLNYDCRSISAKTSF